MRLFSSIYLLLLVYIITAILFWETSLQKQSGRIYAQEMLTLQSRIDSTRFPLYYEHLKGELQVGLRRRTFQYIA
ncbi:MAG: hypothetical protein EBX41_10220, partial [Chitinophagia bacterium]|nr:hypothetical protein [Chitinophagia bacterium]